MKPSSNKNDDRSCLLHQSSSKSVSCDCIKASSCIELAEIRKLDSLLNQCESISCDNLLLHDEIYNYDLCAATKRKYVSTSALHRILPKNSIRRRTHKKVLGICENDSKIIKLIDKKRNREPDDVEADGELTKCCDLNNDGEVDLLRTQSCSNLLLHSTTTSKTTINYCDKTIQTSHGELNGHSVDILCKYLSPDGSCNNHYTHPTQDKRKKAKRKQCSCRDYENVNTICETSLTTLPCNIKEPPTKTPTTTTTTTSWLTTTGINMSQPKKSLLHLKKDKSDDRSSRSSRFTKQKTSIMDDDEGGNNSDCYHENRVININDKSVEVFPISLNSSYSQSVTPRGTSNNLLHDSKSDKSETQSQKSKRSKFSPSFISRKLTSRLNSSEDDGAGGVKESLLGRSKSAEKRLPEQVETVCIEKGLKSFCPYNLSSNPFFVPHE